MNNNNNLMESKEIAATVATVAHNNINNNNNNNNFNSIVAYIPPYNDNKSRGSIISVDISDQQEQQQQQQPLTPTRTIKKVSFSDEMIMKMTAEISENPSINENKQIEQYGKEIKLRSNELTLSLTPPQSPSPSPSPSPIEFMFNKTKRYLKQLHNINNSNDRFNDDNKYEERVIIEKVPHDENNDDENTDHDNDENHIMMAKENVKRNTFTTSLSINLSKQNLQNDEEVKVKRTSVQQMEDDSSLRKSTENFVNSKAIVHSEIRVVDEEKKEKEDNENVDQELESYISINHNNDNNEHSNSLNDTTQVTINRSSIPLRKSSISNSNYSLTFLNQSSVKSLDSGEMENFSTTTVTSPATLSMNNFTLVRKGYDNYQNMDKRAAYQTRNDHHYKQCSSMELEARRDKLRWLLISECSGLLGDGKHTREGFRKLFLDEEFQHKFFQLFDLENNGYLMQDRWIEHLKGRLTQEREMNYAEQLESVAYVVCGENSEITFKNFYDIWHTRGIFDKLFRLIDKEGANLISTSQIMEFISNLTNFRPRTGFDKSSLARLEQLFRNTVGNEREIRREEFKKIVTSKNPFFTERVFQIFDKDNSGSISLQEFIDSIHQFSGQSADDKIRFLFKVYDIDGDGLIQHKELHDVIRACMEENGMEFSEEQIEDLTIAMFEDADSYNRGEITFEALKNQLYKHGGLLENLSITIDRWLVPTTQTNQIKKKSQTICCPRIPIPHQLTTAYMKNNHVFVTYLFIYIAINVCLFVSRAIQYRNSNIFVILARACGQCLNFNCAWILVLMLRHTLTYLRSHGLSTYLPVDNHIYLHKMAGFVVSIFSLIHTIMHLVNFSMIIVNDPLINRANYSLAEWLLTDRPHLFGLVPGCANPTGVALFIILLIMFICSQPFVRRTGSFEVFYWTHLLYIPFWVLCLFHGPNFWKWFIVPGIIYIVERILRYVWMRGEHGKTYISSGLLLPSKVIHLVIKRPFNFNFRPGDYIFVNIPTIAKYEWHPFTISSAPEQEDYMWLHIRTVGEWTNRLYQYFEKEHQKLHDDSINNFASNKQAIPTSSLLRIQENNTSRNSSPLSSPRASVTPQTDFLIKNLNNAQQNGYNIDTQISMTMATAENNGTNDRIKSFKHSFHRTFSRKDSEIKDKERLSGHTNRGFIPDEQRQFDYQDNDTKTESGIRGKKLQKLLLNRPPLEKTISLPDMMVKVKSKSYLRKLHALERSESERPFNQGHLKRHRLNSDGLAYLSPQNRSLAQSFRYMRNKPIIIPFKAPKPNQNKLNETKINPETAPQGIDEANRIEKSSQQKNSIPKFSLMMDKMDQLHFNGDVNTDFIMAKPLEDVKKGDEKRTNAERPVLRKRGTYATLSSLGTINGLITLDEGTTEIFIDGPYGAPSSHIFMAQHAVLIGTGIGVTPFASILQSIMHRYWKARHTCPQCNYEWSSEIPKSVMNLRKVDFFWINRDQRSFEWFVNLLSQLEIEQAELGGAMERFLDMHMYITSALQKTDMKAVCLQLALDLLHEKGKRDLITGLKTRTNAGRPNWDKVFKQLQAQKKGKVTIFYCGPPQLAKTLRYKCDEYGFAFRKECF